MRSRSAWTILGLAAVVAMPVAATAQPTNCPQFFPRGAAPALLNAKLAQRVTVLCNEAYAVAASGVTHGTLSAEHLTAASVTSARDTRRAVAFHPDDRLPPADQAQLADYRASGYDRGHIMPSGDMPDATARRKLLPRQRRAANGGAQPRGVGRHRERYPHDGGGKTTFT